GTWDLEEVSGPPTLTALELPGGRRLWEKTWEAREPIEDLEEVPPAPPAWPLVADLAGDGRPAVVLPALHGQGANSFASIEALGGGTGERLWLHPLTRRRRKLSSAGIQMLAGPDLDGDGRREVFVVSLYDGELFVDALSGADGRPLWWRSHPLPEG